MHTLVRNSTGLGRSWAGALDCALTVPADLVRGQASPRGRDIVDFVFTAAAAITRGFHHVIALTQSGRLRWYATNMAAGLLIVLLIVLEVI